MSKVDKIVEEIWNHRGNVSTAAAGFVWVLMHEGKIVGLTTRVPRKFLHMPARARYTRVNSLLTTLAEIKDGQELASLPQATYKIHMMGSVLFAVTNTEVVIDTKSSSDVEALYLIDIAADDAPAALGEDAKEETEVAEEEEVVVDAPPAQ